MKNLPIWLSVLVVIFLLAVAFMSNRPEGFTGHQWPAAPKDRPLVYPEGFIDAASFPVPGTNTPYITSPAATPVPPSAQGIEPAAAGVPNSVIPNAPAPPTAGMAQTLTPVNLEANYEELRGMLTNLNKNLPADIKQQVANLTPAIVNGMIQARDPKYAAKA